jgi:hypothetical protein
MPPPFAKPATDRIWYLTANAKVAFAQLANSNIVLIGAKCFVGAVFLL